MSNSFSFNGYDFGDPDYGVTCTEREYEVLSQPRLNATPRSGGHGSIIRSPFFTEKTIKVPCVIQGSSWSDMLAKVDAFRSILLSDPNNDHQLILDWQSDRYINARVSAVATGVEYGQRSMKTEVTFVAGDPLWYGTTEITGSKNIAGSGTTLYNWSPPIGGSAYTGTIETPLSITVYNGDGPGLNPRLVNQSYENTHGNIVYGYWKVGGEGYIPPYNVGEYQYINFDSENETVTSSMDGINWISLADKICTSEVDWYGVRRLFRTNIMLYPTGIGWDIDNRENEIYVGGFHDPITVTWRYRMRWI